jgi:hypothetical protein
MNSFRVVGIFHVILFSSLHAQNIDQVRRMEAAGDLSGARTALLRAAEGGPANVAALTNYAEFLDRHSDPASLQAYARLLTVLRQQNDSANSALVARRLAALDLESGDRDGAVRQLETYRAVSGRNLMLGSAAARQNWPTASIPGPLRSFARMAAMPAESSPEDILPALARNIVTNGYQASHSNEELEQTEFLKLVHRYLSQARELDKLAGEKKVIEVQSCESPNAAELLRILGFRMRGGCGSDVVLETVNATRAFLTTDSGFPINELEQALRTNRPFTYDYRPTMVPVLFGPEYWLPKEKDKEARPDFLETFIGDPAICRLYLGFSKLDSDTADALRKVAPLSRLRVYSHVLDFFGGMFEVRGGKAVVPGGQRSAGMWAELVGASADQGGAFFDKLLAKDDGWLASLYDALARINGPVRDYLVEPARMKRFYTAIRGRITSPGPARPVFRSNTDMMLLTTRMRLDPNGKPHIPGSLDVWKELFTNNPQAKYDGKLTRLAASWKEPDDVLEALFALSRKSAENEPLKIFMAINDLDRNRSKPLEAATVERLSRAFRAYGSQYPIFSESRTLTDKSIGQYLDTAEAVNKIRDPELRSDVAGSFDSLISLWQVFVRQQSLRAADADSTFAGIASSFAQIRNSRELFDAGRSDIKLLLGAIPAGQSSATAAEPQERIIDLLAGASSSEDAEAREQVAQDILRILEAQRIVSLDTLFQLADHLESISKGEKLNNTLVAKLTGRISEIQLPRASLSANEKNAIAFGYWTEKHIEDQRRLNLRAAVEKAAGDPEKLKDARGLLAPLLRDTLLAYNYAYYAPPGSQILYTNPVFVRSHDFIGNQGSSRTWKPTEVLGSGWPSSAGGRLVGSLSSLPYALAEAEQNFLIPAQTQALIWSDLVPQMILSAKIPRWWNVTPSQVHWVGLHIRYGRELIAESAFDPELRRSVLEQLSVLAAPVRTREVGRLLEEGNVKEAIDRVTPSELFSVGREFAGQNRAEASCLAAEIARLAKAAPQEINYETISRAFGSPKPTLANSYEPELMNLRTFPTLMGYSSRIMAESWESNTLYWAALADELAVRPAELNVRIPEWTQMLVEHIFASHLEDWPAVLKSLRLVGDDIRAKTRAAVATDQKAALQEFPVR